MQFQRRCEFREYSRKVFYPYAPLISIVCRIHYSVLDALVAHFIRFVDDIRVTHVIHLAPVSSYFCATLEVQVRTNKEYKEHFQTLLKKQSTIL
ncbi:hypothetical protein HID58_080169 [Brassica napus]|uniref:Uncharacterized protein n=1 Tax=Brassica napus TaxID=3708 RepID=A0ABQ7Y457_BRANA|nr:hypothetical protein HID58_080169 [Brassica napus]